MKYLNLLIALFFTFGLFGQAQPGMNGEYVDGNFDPNPLPVGSTSTLSIVVVAGNYDVAPGDVQIVVDFPNGGAYIDITPVTGPIPTPGSAAFSWTRVPSAGGGSDTWLGVNIDPLPANWGGGEYLITVQGVIEGSNPEVTLVNAYFPDDNAQDNPGVIVSAPTPIELLSFAGVSRDCKNIELNWKTGSEINNDYMEILRSTNGKDFISIGKVKGTNDLGGSTYTLIDETDLVGGTRYFYKIRQVDFDGAINFHKVIVVNFNCKTSNPRMSIYPNPASEKVNITIAGLEERDVNAVIINKDGVKVKKIVLNSAQSNELNLEDLPSGVYNIQSLDLDEPINQSFIRVK
ncbi:MAG: T9SS type A sorting domain-containing protein [Deltaproteobacteria bacterium]